jgi:hypothetical protein
MRWKRQDKTQWHRVFAWWPVTTVCKTVVWLEFVEYKAGRYEPAVPYGDWKCLVELEPPAYRLIEEGKKQ